MVLFITTTTFLETLVWNVRRTNLSCPTLCSPMDCSPPGTSIHGISQARIVEWVAISFSRGSNLSLLHWQVDSYRWSTRETPFLILLTKWHKIISLCSPNSFFPELQIFDLTTVKSIFMGDSNIHNYNVISIMFQTSQPNFKCYLKSPRFTHTELMVCYLLAYYFTYFTNFFFYWINNFRLVVM